jgi:hypothetical protein
VPVSTSTQHSPGDVSDGHFLTGFTLPNSREPEMTVFILYASKEGKDSQDLEYPVLAPAEYCLDVV